jgi:CDP-diacylglycerol--glycerol-3-phosphate 3-phosphatidyltransferase
MNLPNKLTILRVAMIPLCLLFALLGFHTAAAGVFALAALTDLLDGHIARKHNMVTNFGKFADPVADKILVLSVMIVLLYQGLFPWWAVCVVAIRELAVDGLRLVAVEQGLVIPAGKLGKFKTNAQIFSVLAALLFLPGWLVMALAVIMSVLTVISGIQYFYGARSVFQMEETERKI